MKDFHPIPHSLKNIPKRWLTLRACCHFLQLKRKKEKACYTQCGHTIFKKTMVERI